MGCIWIRCAVATVVQVDDEIVEHPLMVLDLASDLPALSEQAGDGVGAFCRHAPIVVLLATWQRCERRRTLVAPLAQAD